MSITLDDYSSHSVSISLLHVCMLTDNKSLSIVSLHDICPTKNNAYHCWYFQVCGFTCAYKPNTFKFTISIFVSP